MIFPEVEAHIESIKNNPSLYDEKSFDARADVIDFLEFYILDQDRLTELHHQAQKVKSQLEEIDNKLFQRLQREIKQKKHSKACEELIKGYVNFESNRHEDEGYDNLDIFVNRLLSFQDMPEQSKFPEPEMVFYQKTPARIIFELVQKAGFTKDDVFFDIGSGLGQVAMLVNLLTGIRTVGVEFDPAFCKYSEECAITLGLQDVAFFNVDAREADYSEGTVFFMYTPFSGKMLQGVSDLLRKESLKRQVRIITYGPCTAEVARQDWLHYTSEAEPGVNRLTFFIS